MHDGLSSESVRSKLKVISRCVFASAACAHHRPLVALSHPADQLQSGPEADEPHTNGDESAKQHVWQQRASATGPGHLLQGEPSGHLRANVPVCLQNLFLWNMAGWPSLSFQPKRVGIWHPGNETRQSKQILSNVTLLHDKIPNVSNNVQTQRKYF